MSFLIRSPFQFTPLVCSSPTRRYAICVLLINVLKPLPNKNDNFTDPLHKQMLTHTHLFEHVLYFCNMLLLSHICWCISYIFYSITSSVSFASPHSVYNCFQHMRDAQEILLIDLSSLKEHSLSLCLHWKSVRCHCLLGRKKLTREC